MKNRSSARSAQAIAPAALPVCILSLFIPGSVALSRPVPPSFMLDSAIVRVPTFGYVSYTSAAVGPDVALIVWVEGDGGGALLGARVSSDGTLLDTTTNRYKRARRGRTRQHEAGRCVGRKPLSGCLDRGDRRPVR